MFFVSADSKGLSVPVSYLFSTLTRGSISVDSKGFTLHQDGAEWAASRAPGSKGFTFNDAGGMAKKENRQLGCRTAQFFLLKILSRKESSVKGQIARKSGGAELFPPEFPRERIPGELLGKDFALGICVDGGLNA